MKREKQRTNTKRKFSFNIELKKKTKFNGK